MLSLNIYCETSLLHQNLNILALCRTRNTQPIGTCIGVISQNNWQVALSTLRYPRYNLFHANELCYKFPKTRPTTLKLIQPISIVMN